MRMVKIGTVLALALLAALLAVGVASAKPGETYPALTASVELRKAVGPAAIVEHERRFQRIADANGGNRAAGTPGYAASAKYVARRLEAAGYEVTVQIFDFPYFEVLSRSFSQTSPEEQQHTFEPYDHSTNAGDYAVMYYSGSGTVEDTPVVPTSDVVIPPVPRLTPRRAGANNQIFRPRSRVMWP